MKIQNRTALQGRKCILHAVEGMKGEDYMGTGLHTCSIRFAANIRVCIVGDDLLRSNLLLPLLGSGSDLNTASFAGTFQRTPSSGSRMMKNHLIRPNLLRPRFSSRK
ncbi:hypothetical protein AVEN_143382-1 [Araneus ventricosus]|uniref:Uncharacterized protein n=1 Tax=Araneus ventricosus TaxID=182803 RepID=A0A4Y2AFT3_ARAVE|nr:hypothetical protein AVEN_143382-1 [Araneus ventricosus]